MISFLLRKIGFEGCLKPYTKLRIFNKHKNKDGSGYPPRKRGNHGDKAYHQQNQNIQLGAKEPNNELHLLKLGTTRELTICILLNIVVVVCEGVNIISNQHKLTTSNSCQFCYCLPRFFYK